MKAPRIFYGWLIVGACFIVAFYVGGVVYFGFTAFFEPIANEFGWSYTQISFAASLRGMEVGLLSPAVGILIDRWGPRWIMFGGLILAGFGLIFISQTTSLAMFYGGFAMVAVGTSACSGAVVMTAVANWFNRKIGIATGITISGVGLGGLMIPLIVKLIDIFQWQTALFIFGLGFCIVISPLALILRHRPEPYGYLPDGAENAATIPTAAQEIKYDSKSDIGAKQALRSRAFWHISLALTVQFIAFTAVTTHVMPYLSSIGIDRSTSGLIATTLPVISIGGRLSSGWFSDKFNKIRVTVVYCAVTLIGLLLFYYIPQVGIWLVVPFAIFIGIGWGGHSTIRAALTREYFGRSSFGTIIGLMAGFIAIVGVVGPPLAGWIFDISGSYSFAWLLFAFLLFIALIILMTTPPATRR